MVFALDVFGDRWSLLVIRDLAMRESSTYSQFLAAGEGISTNVLADRLKRLEAKGILSKEPDPEHAGRSRYRLTPKGRDLLPVLLEMIRWSAKHDPESPIPADLRATFESDPRAAIAEWLALLSSRPT